MLVIMGGFLYGGIGLTFVTDPATKTVTVVPGTPFTQFSTLAQALAPALPYTDLDAVYAPSVAATGAAQTLLPGLVRDTDPVHALTTTRFLQAALLDDADAIFSPARSNVLVPALVSAPDAIYAADADLVHNPHKTQKVRPGTVSDNEVVYPPNSVQRIRLEMG